MSSNSSALSPAVSDETQSHSSPALAPARGQAGMGPSRQLPLPPPPPSSTLLSHSQNLAAAVARRLSSSRERPVRGQASIDSSRSLEADRAFAAQYAAFFLPRTHTFDTFDARTPVSKVNLRSPLFPRSSSAGAYVSRVRVALALLVGVCVAIVAFASDQLTRAIANIIYRVAAIALLRPGPATGGVMSFFLAAAALILPGMAFISVASLLVVFVAPLGASSGIPQLKAYLNGVRVPGFLSFKTCVVKAVGIGLSTGSGLVTGRQGAMGHVGAIIGAGMSQAASSHFGFRLEFGQNVTRRRSRFAGKKSQNRYVNSDESVATDSEQIQESAAGRQEGLRKRFTLRWFRRCTEGKSSCDKPEEAGLHVEKCDRLSSPSVASRIGDNKSHEPPPVDALKYGGADGENKKSHRELLRDAICSLRTNEWKRNFATVGAGIGIATTLSAPIGGWMWIYEEAATHWDWPLGVITLVGCVTGVALSSFLRFMATGNLQELGTITFEEVGRLAAGSDSAVQFPVRDVPAYVVVAAVGGIIGAGLPFINKRVTLARYRYASKPLARVTEAALIVGVTNFFRVFIPYVARDCRPIDEGVTTALASVSELDFKRFNCPLGEYSPYAALIYNPHLTVLRLALYTPGRVVGSTALSLPAMPLFVASVFYYGFILVSFGIAVPSGVFLPAFVLGSVYGRLIGTFVQLIFPARQDVSLEGYAFLGVVSALSGINRGISVSIIALEATGALDASFAAVFVALIARAVAEYLHRMSIYDVHVEIKGMPYLADTVPLPETYYRVRVADVMSTHVVGVRCRSRVDELLRVLSDTPHNAYPVFLKQRFNKRLGDDLYHGEMSHGAVKREADRAPSSHHCIKISEATPEVKNVSTSRVRRVDPVSEMGIAEARGMQAEAEQDAGASSLRLRRSESIIVYEGHGSFQATIVENGTTRQVDFGGHYASPNDARTTRRVSPSAALKPLKHQTGRKDSNLIGNNSSHDSTLRSSGPDFVLLGLIDRPTLLALLDVLVSSTMGNKIETRPCTEKQRVDDKQKMNEEGRNFTELREGYPNGENEKNSSSLSSLSSSLSPSSRQSESNKDIELGIRNEEADIVRPKPASKPLDDDLEQRQTSRKLPMNASRPITFGERYRVTRDHLDAAWPNTERVKKADEVLNRVRSAGIGNAVIDLADYVDPDPLLISDGAMTYAAYKLIRSTGARHVLVTNTREGRIAGIVTRKDILPESVVTALKELREWKEA